jgi:hypothetical protein
MEPQGNFLGKHFDIMKRKAFQCPRCGYIMVCDTDVLSWMSTADEEELGRSWNNCVLCPNQINALAIRDGHLRPASFLTHWYLKRKRMRHCR